MERSRWTCGLWCALLSWAMAGSPIEVAAFEVNGRHWDELPVPVYVNVSEAPEFDGALSALDVVQAAMDQWNSVACSGFQFVLMGTTEATWAPDGQNVIFWESDDWQFQDEAAGATLWLPKAEGELPEVDLALNGDNWQWTVGGGNALQSDTVDPVSVITHELGHWLGLSHTADPFATMYFALLPNALQATLDADDKAGVCHLYPNGSNGECELDGDCPQEQVCREVAGFRLCGDRLDSTGDACSKTNIKCDGMCWTGFYECSSICMFTSIDYSDGYCAPLCGEGIGGCGDGYECVEYPAYSISVCTLTGFTVDTGPESIEAVEDEPDVVDAVEEVVFGDMGSWDQAVNDSADDWLEPDTICQLCDLGSGDKASGHPDGVADDNSAEPGIYQPAGNGSGCAAVRHTSFSNGRLLALALLGLALMACRIRAKTS